MNVRLLAASLAIAAVLATPATAAAEVELRISAGRVWLKAVNATVAQILKEWSRLGQTQIVNGDNVPGGPVTLQLDNVSEEEALDVLLKSAAGFMGVRRSTPVAANSRIRSDPDPAEEQPGSGVPAGGIAGAAGSGAATGFRPTRTAAVVYPRSAARARSAGATGARRSGRRTAAAAAAEPPPQPAPYSPQTPFGQPPGQPARIVNPRHARGSPGSRHDGAGAAPAASESAGRSVTPCADHRFTRRARPAHSAARA